MGNAFRKKKTCGYEGCNIRFYGKGGVCQNHIVDYGIQLMIQRFIDIMSSVSEKSYL